MKKFLKNIAIILSGVILFTGATTFATGNDWLNQGGNLFTNTGNGLANADIHVANCYIGTGTGTPCGGGGVSGTGANEQVAYWTGPHTISSDGDFTYTTGTNPIFNVGDVTELGNGTIFKVDDGASLISAQATNGFAVNDPSGNTWLDVNPSVNAVAFGNINDTLNGNVFTLNDSTQQITAANRNYGQYLLFDAPNDNFFFGNDAGQITSVQNMIALGEQSGYSATFADNSTFIGVAAGAGASQASSSIFLGIGAGASASLANDSIFIGNNAGGNSGTANNSNYIIHYNELAGTFGVGDVITDGNTLQTGIVLTDDGVGTMTVSISSVPPDNQSFLQGDGLLGSPSGASATVTSASIYTSILIGPNTSTGEYSNSVAIGNGATNTAANQFLISSPVNPFTLAEIDATKTFMNGGQQTAVTVVGADTDYQILPSDYVVEMNPVSATVTATLPTSPTKGDTYIIKNEGTTYPYSTIIDGNGNNIDGNSTITLAPTSGLEESVTLVFDGTEWSIISAYSSGI